MTTLGLVFAAAAVGALFIGRRAFACVLAASAAVPASAAVTVAGTSVSPFYALAAVASVLLLFDTRRAVAAPGGRLLTVFAAWSLLVTLVAPFVFRGVRVLSPREGVDNAVMSPDPLGFSVSSLAQAGYLVLALSAVMFIVRSGVGPMVVALPLALGTALSSVAAGMAWWGIPWPHEFFDTSVNVMYSDTSDGVESRLRGVFSEPSELAGFSLASLAFFAVAAFRAGPRARAAAAILAAAAAVNLQLASSGTAVMGLVIFLAIASSAGIVHLVRRGGRSLPLVTIAVLLSTVVAVLFLDDIAAEAGAVVNGKVGSISFISRTTADLFSLGLLGETAGVGVGLGANRPSSFGAMLLSSVGVVGTAAFVGAVVVLIARAAKSRAGVPGVWGLIALLTAKAVALPDLSVPVLWMLIAACAAGAWRVADTESTGRKFDLHSKNANISALMTKRRGHGPEGVPPADVPPLEADPGDRRRRGARRSRHRDAHRAAIHRDSAAVRGRAG